MQEKGFHHLHTPVLSLAYLGLTKDVKVYSSLLVLQLKDHRDIGQHVGA